MGSINGLHHPLEFGIALLCLGDIGRELDDANGFAALVQDGIVRGLEPDLAPVFCEAFVFRLKPFTVCEPFPKIRVVGRFNVVFLAEHPVVLAHQLLDFESHGTAEVVVGRDNRSVEVEFDDRQASIQRIVYRSPV